MADTRQTRRGDARAYLSKAHEFLHAATESLAIGNNTAAAGNAIHAGINGADAIAAATTRSVWRGEHSQAARHLLGAGDAGRQASGHLRRLIGMKTAAEYDPDPIQDKDARAAVTAAKRLVAIAEQVVLASSS